MAQGLTNSERTELIDSSLEYMSKTQVDKLLHSHSVFQYSWLPRVTLCIYKYIRCACVMLSSQGHVTIRLHTSYI